MFRAMFDGCFAIPLACISWVLGWFLPFFEKIVVGKFLLPHVVEKNLVPDFLIRFGIRLMIWGKVREESSANPQLALAKKQAYIANLKTLPIAINTADANRQHYEVPAAFYGIVLGPWKKYSSCYWTEVEATASAGSATSIGAAAESLGEAEENMLKIVCERSRMDDTALRVLDLGCGWGSCSLYIATKYPNARVTGVSNSNSQRQHNESEAAKRGLTNVQFITCDINTFEPKQQFDRIITNEMFEHMKNYELLLSRVSSWLSPAGLLFVHIFTHRDVCYHYTDGWMAENFFTGGQMPSADLLLYFAKDVCIESQWAVNGLHYKRTLDAWLARQDRNEAAVRKVFTATYGDGNDLKWHVYWRLFLLACSENFGYNNGNDYQVSHYLFSKRNTGASAPAAAAAAVAASSKKSKSSGGDRKE